MSRYDMRIGDSERDAAVTALGEHYVAGRLTKEEYDERSDVAWKARTNSDLAPLFYDLPPVQPPQPQARASTPVSQPGRSRSSGVPVLPVFVLALVVMFATGLEIWPLLLVLVFYLWIKAAFWRGCARKQQRRALRRTVPEPWRQQRRY